MKTSTQQDGNTQCHESRRPRRFPFSFILCFDPAYNTDGRRNGQAVLRSPALISKYTFLICFPVAERRGEARLPCSRFPVLTSSFLILTAAMLNTLAAHCTCTLDSFTGKEHCSSVSRRYRHLNTAYWKPVRHFTPNERRREKKKTKKKERESYVVWGV